MKSTAADLVEEEEEDYMSDAFLQKILEADEASKKRKPRRRNPSSSKSVKKKRKSAREQLHSGLEANIIDKAEQNGSIALKMMLNMGYKRGRGLGSQETGRVEPVRLNLASDKRAGVGLEESICRKAETKKKRQQETLAAQEEEFKRWTASRFEDKALRRLERQAFQTAQRMDEDHGVTESRYIQVVDPTDDTPEQDSAIPDDDDNGIIPQLKDTEQVREDLISTLEYLRSQYLFCIYCGHSFVDSEELDRLCPGILEQDH